METKNSVFLSPTMSAF